MKVNGIWLVVVGVLMTIGSVLFMLQCGPNRKPPATPCPVVNLDSLEKALRDTLLVPGPKQQIETVKWAISTKDTATIDSLLELGKQQQAYWAGIVGQLEEISKSREKDLKDEIERLQLIVKTNVYEDSIRTADYFFRFKITALGPIEDFYYGITPTPRAVLQPLKKVKDHRIGLGFGGQAEAGVIRQLYLGKYQYKWAWVQIGYLPESKKLGVDDAVQLSAGFTFGIK